MTRSGAAAEPYPPSWVDRLFERIDALPVPAWITYLAVFLVVAAAGNGVGWAERTVPRGTIDGYQTSLAFYVVIAFAAMHHLDDAAERAWVSFRGAIEVDEERARSVRQELTTLPAGTTLLWTAVGLAGMVAYFVLQYGQPLDFEREPLTLAFDIVVSVPAFAGVAILAYHSIRQLRLIARLYGSVERVDLLHLEPLHAFARVTATTGLALLSVVYVSAVTDPATFANPALFVLLVGTVALAVGCFVIPLSGIHATIAGEKGRRLAAANRRLDVVLADLDRRADDDDLAEADAVNKRLSSLIAQRDLLARVSTWPWQPETLRAFVTAIVVPIVLWLVLRLLERQLT